MHSLRWCCALSIFGPMKKKKKSQDLLFPDAVQDLVYSCLHLGLFLFSIVFYFIRLQFAAMDLVFYSTTWTLDVLLDWFLS